MAGGLVLGSSLMLYTVASTMPVLVAAWLLTGVGEALLFVASCDDDQRPRAARPPWRGGSLYSLATWGGLAVGPPLGEFVLGDDRFDAVWLAGRRVVARWPPCSACAFRETRPAGVRDNGRPQQSARPPGGDHTRPRADRIDDRVRGHGGVRTALRP